MAFGKLGARGGFGSLGGVGGAHGRAPFLGQVATRSQALNNILGVTTGINSRSLHYIRGGAVSSLQIVVANWHTVAGSGDTSQGGAKVATASLEYPLGTYTRIKFGGLNSVTIADGANAISDPLNLSLPDGAQFAIKIYQTNAVGVEYYDGARAPGEIINNSNVDETLTSSADGFGTARICPVAIVALTTRPSIGQLGTSNAIGLGESNGEPNYDIGFMRLYGDVLPYISVANSSDSTAVQLASPKRLALMDTYVTHRWLEPGPGDGSDVPTVLGYVATFNARWPKANNILSNIGPTTTSTDNWATSANQTITAQESFRLGCNAGFAAITGMNQLVDINALTTQPSFPGIIKNDGVTPFGFTIDGGHWNTPMFLFMKANNPFNISLVH